MKYYKVRFSRWDDDQGEIFVHTYSAEAAFDFAWDLLSPDISIINSIDEITIYEA